VPVAFGRALRRSIPAFAYRLGTMALASIALLGTARTWVKGRHWFVGLPMSLEGIWNSSRQRAQAYAA
jgi:hypothetical protein